MTRLFSPSAASIQHKLFQRRWSVSRPPLVLVAVATSSLDDGDGPQLDGLPADAGVVTRVHHVRHVLVRLRSLRQDERLKVSGSGSDQPG